MTEITHVQDRKKVTKLAITALCTALIIVATFIKIPTPLGIPITMQLPVIILIGLLLGPYWGTAATGSFVLLGLLGLPVFTGGGGFTYLYSPSFGFLYGFIAGTFMSGFILKFNTKLKFKTMLTASLMNLGIVYMFGVLHFWLIKNFWLGENISLSTSVIALVFTIFLVKDIIMAVLASLLALKLRPLIMQYVNFY